MVNGGALAVAGRPCGRTCGENGEKLLSYRLPELPAGTGCRGTNLAS